MRPSLGLLAAAVIAGALAGCGPPTDQRRRIEYIVMHPNMPEEVKKAIRKKAIIRGMTKADVRICWGRPHRIEKVGEKSEAWIYRRKVYGVGWQGHVRTYRVVFIDDRVATFLEIARSRR